MSRATRTYLLQKGPDSGLKSGRVDILLRFAGFFQSLGFGRMKQELAKTETVKVPEQHQWRVEYFDWLLEKKLYHFLVTPHVSTRCHLVIVPCG